MILLIIIFASLMTLAGLVLLIHPHPIFEFIRNNKDGPAIHAIAVITRLIVGALLLMQSDVSRFPLTIAVFGWIFVVAGLSLAIIGRSRFRQVVAWVTSTLAPFARFAGAIAMAVGGFLVYAFL